MEDKSNGGKNNVRLKDTRDFPPGFGDSNLPFKVFSGKRSVHNYARDFPPGCGANVAQTTHIGGDWRRSVGAVRTKPPLMDGAEEAPKTFQNIKKKGKLTEVNFSEKGSMERENVGALKKGQNFKGREIRSKEREHVVDVKGKEKEQVLINSGEREKVVEMLRLFRKRCSDIAKSGRGVRRVDTTAYGELKNEGKLVNRSALMFGNVPGIEVGDKFHYRIELLIVGLHKQTQGGIDTMEWGGGRAATSIVANEKHLDKMNDPNTLTYVGEGGNLKRHEVGIPPDQELKSGNLALWTSMKEKRPVRVIRGLVSEMNHAQKLYVYDGLYDVRECEKKRGPQGNMIFEFQLSRCDGQPAVPWQECRRFRF